MDLSTKKPLIAGVAVVGLAIVAWLAFGFFGIQAAFIDNEVNESADDLFTATPAETESAASADDNVEPDASQAATPEPAEQTATALAQEPADEEPTDDVAIVDEAPADETPAEAPPATEDEVEDEVEEPPAEQAPAPVEEETPEEETVEEETVEEQPATPGEIVTIASGNFASINGYSVTGDALVLNNGTEERFLRFENFVSDNGPDLKVYLRAANGDFVSLGDLSGNIGDQNYAIPVDVDLSVFTNVEIWCERFSAGFGVATLA